MTDRGKKQQVEPFDLQDAARALRDLAKDLESHVLRGFQKDMAKYSPDSAGATGHNPFGAFTEGRRLRDRLDYSQQSAVEDGQQLLRTFAALSDALDAAATFYLDTEGRNTRLTKSMMNDLLAGKQPGPTGTH